MQTRFNKVITLNESILKFLALNGVLTRTVIERTRVDHSLNFFVQTFWENVRPSTTVRRHPDLGQARIERVEQSTSGPKQKRLDGVMVKFVVADLKYLN